jgi:hypothetical protein
MRLLARALFFPVMTKARVPNPLTLSAILREASDPNKIFAGEKKVKSMVYLQFM